MKYLSNLLLLLFALFICQKSIACTSAIVVASHSKEGSTLLWKHRDAPSWDCHIEHFKDGKHAFTALVSPDKKKVYSGINECGFAILNTVSENITKDLSLCQGPGALFVMAYALREFATVEEFEMWLATTNGKRTYVTNFAVGDASGAAAYFEVKQESFKRFDIGEQKEGFDIRSNFSFSGNMVERGPSVPRYDIVMRQMSCRKMHSPYDFFDYGRNYVNGSGVEVLTTSEKFICNDLTVPRYFSVASMVMVCDGENPRMLVSVGHPVVAMVVPVYVKAENSIPECVAGRPSLLLSEEFRAKAYTQLDELRYDTNKPLVKRLLKVESRVVMPNRMPENIEKFNAKIDTLFAKHAAKVRKVLVRY